MPYRFLQAHRVGAARRSTQTELRVWWPERRCRATWGEVVRPDGYGVWAEDGAEVAFFLEYDRGFEAIVVGEPARAFCGNQFGLTFPVFVHYGIELRVPEVGGAVDPGSDTPTTSSCPSTAGCPRASATASGSASARP